MRTNIERAINDLILSNKDITLVNALPAYLREAGFKELSLDALIAFEHALDKYPTHPGESRSVFIEGISGISAEYWASKIELLVDVPCVLCDACARKSLTLKAEMKVHGCGHPGEAKTPKHRLKSKKMRRRVRAKRDVVAAGFDPYAPSTSAVML